MTLSAITFVVAALACYRLVMLVTRDALTAPWRDRLASRYVHPVHVPVWRSRSREPFAHVRAGAGRPTGADSYPYIDACSCGERWAGDDWSTVASAFNEHFNAGRGETTTGPWWLELADCPWCASVWISAPVAWSAWCFADRAWWAVPAIALACSALTGMIATYAAPPPRVRS